MSDLPTGWAWSEFGKVADCQLGKMLDAAKNKGTLRPYLRNINVRWFGFDLDDLKQMRVTDAEGEQFGICDGDVLICEGGEPGRAAVWRGGKTALTIQKALHRARPNGAYEADLLASFLRYATAERQIDGYLTGSTIKHLPQSALRRVAVPVPPLAEQRRIVAKVDGLTQRITRARADLSRIPTLIARYKERLLALALSGELTAEWREKSRVDADYTQARVEDVAEIITGFTPPTDGRDRFFGGSIPFFKPTDLDAGYHVTVPRETLTKEGADRGRRVPSGATLVTCIGATIGKTGFARVDCCTNQQINALVPDLTKVQAEWLFWMVLSPEFQRSIIDNSSATTLPIINKGRFKKLEVSVPSLTEQAEIVRRLESAFGWLDRMAADHAAAARLIPKLDAAILTKAFRGELVAQDPNDEPAAVFLERIRTEREAAPKKGRRKPQGTTLSSSVRLRDEIRLPATTSKDMKVTKSRNDPDVKGEPYLANILRRMDGIARAEALYARADLTLVDFYKQLSNEHDRGWLVDDDAWVKVA